MSPLVNGITTKKVPDEDKILAQKALILINLDDVDDFKQINFVR